MSVNEPNLVLVVIKIDKVGTIVMKSRVHTFSSICDILSKSGGIGPNRINYPYHLIRYYKSDT